jgi:hypothetical protein
MARDFKAIAKAANESVRLIVDDIEDRRGLKHEWRGIDEDIRRDIRKTWASIIVTQIAGLANEPHPVIERLRVYIRACRAAGQDDIADELTELAEFGGEVEGGHG